MTNSTILKSVLGLLLVGIFLSPATLWAQKTAPLPKLQNKKAAQVYGATITAQDLKKHLTVLASDEFAGRGNGQEGIEFAANYLAQQFAAIGIPPYNGSYFQEYPLIRQAWGKPTISINGKEYAFMKDFYCFARGNASLNLHTTEIVFAGYGIDDPKYSDYGSNSDNPLDVKNRVVVVMNGEPRLPDGKYLLTNSLVASEWTSNWRKKLETASKYGAKALIVVVDDIDKRVNQYKHFINSESFELKDLATKENAPQNANSVYISTQMAEELLQTTLATLEAKAATQPNNFTLPTNLHLNLQKQGEEVMAKNVLGYIEGTDLKNEVLVLTAHYDHLGIEDGSIYYGADDDGSGTVALIEIAEAFWQAKKAGKGPRRSVLIMPVSTEEKGLLGSQYYTDINPVFPLNTTVANLNIDMIGRIDPEHLDGNYLYIIGSDKLSTELHSINEFANKTYTRLDLDYRFNSPNDPNRFYYRSDHYNFAKNNVPVIFYFNGTHNDYHKPTDTIEKINFPAMQKRTQLVFYTAWHLANQTPRIKVDVNKP